MLLKRSTIYAKDIARITGRSERYARKKLAAIRQHLGKEKHQLVTLREFCAYAGLQESDVEKYL